MQGISPSTAIESESIALIRRAMDKIESIEFMLSPVLVLPTPTQENKDQRILSDLLAMLQKLNDRLDSINIRIAL